MTAQNAFIKAVMRGDRIAAAARLTEGADINAPDAAGYKPLFRAIAENDRAMTAFLLKNGADKDAPDDLGYSPLQDAIKQGRYDIAFDLMDLGASTAKPEGSVEYSPLKMLAFYASKDEGQAKKISRLTERLIEADAGMLARKDGAGSPLGWAIDNESMPVAAVLLKTGAPLEVGTEIRIALFKMIVRERKKSAEILNFLLEHGLDLKAVQTELNALCTQTKPDVKEPSIAFQEHVKDVLNQNDGPAFGKRCIAWAVEVEALRRQRELHSALENQQRQLAQALIEEGATLSSSQKQDATPKMLKLYETLFLGCVDDDVYKVKGGTARPVRLRKLDMGGPS